MIKIENILVATDFSETSDSALSYGRALARNFGAELHVLNVVENSLMWTGVEGVAFDFAEVQAEIEEAARKKLSTMVGLVDDVKTKPVVRTGSSPAFVIVDYARDAKVDLIVMGTHGRSALGHLLVGSVAERVVRLAPCPVLTVRRPEHEFVLPDALQAVAATRR
jgi:nucleotide-binding universal stress UspA family protein